MTVPQDAVKKHIAEALKVAAKRVTERSEELFASEIASTGNGGASPFQKILVPESRIFSAFERSLSASLGKAFDYIGADIAKATYGNGEHDYKLEGKIATQTLSRIEVIVKRYQQRVGSMPDTVSEMAELAPIINAQPANETRIVKNDVFFVDHEGFRNYLEIKTVAPNYDTCAAMKTRVLTIRAMKLNSGENVRALAVFPHNPNGIVGAYAWPPVRYFLDPKHDWFARGKQLMGAGLWNFIGNSDDTYDDLLECFYQVSLEKKDELLKLLRLD